MSLITQYSETYIANIAIQELDGNEITNIETDTSKEATLARLWYPVARDFVLASYPWSVTRTRYKDVASEAVVPLWKWAHAHAIPSNTLRVLDTSLTVWDVENVNGNRRVVTNETPVSLFTIDRVINVAQYSPIMITALAKWLVSLMAIPLTADDKRKKTATEEFVAILGQAQSIDSYQGSFELFQFNELIEQR